MSTDRNDGGAAFPFKGEQWTEHGMSLRDYFAGQALAGLLASNSMYGGRTDARDQLAGDAYCHADAMLAARAKVQS
jgi:hypothetical protein